MCIAFIDRFRIISDYLLRLRRRAEILINDPPTFVDNFTKPIRIERIHCSVFLEPGWLWKSEGSSDPEGPFWQCHCAAGCQRINTRFGIAPSQSPPSKLSPHPPINFSPSCELQMEFITRCLISIRWLQFIFHKHLSAHLTVTCPRSPGIAKQLSHRHLAKIYY